MNDESNYIPIDISFGEFLRRSRRKKGQSQTDLGEDLGYTQSTISMWELGITSPYIQVAEDIIDHLGGKLIIIPKEVWEGITVTHGNSEQ